MYDLKTYRIPNQVIIFSLSLYLFLSLFTSSIVISIRGLCSAILCILLLFPIYFIHAIGAGDIKLLAVVSCFLGFRQGMVVVVFSFLVGAVISIIYLIRTHILFRQMQSIAFYLSYIYQTKKVVPYKNFSKSKKNCIHFSLPILISTILVLGGGYGGI